MEAFIKKSECGKFYTIVYIDNKGLHHDVDAWKFKRDAIFIAKQNGYKIVKIN
jgi:hypothetical protein